MNLTIQKIQKNKIIQNKFRVFLKKSRNQRKKALKDNKNPIQQILQILSMKN